MKTQFPLRLVSARLFLHCGVTAGYYSQFWFCQWLSASSKEKGQMEWESCPQEPHMN